MRARARLVVGAGVSLAAGFVAVLTFLGASPPPARARVEIIGHKASNDTIVVTVSVTNIGKVILEAYEPYQNSFQYVEWWPADHPTDARHDFVYLDSMWGSLAPGGQALPYVFALPAEARKVRAGFRFRIQSPRTRVALRLHYWGLWDRLHPFPEWLMRFVPRGRTNDTVFWSETTAM